MIADRIVIENNEIVFHLDMETAGANSAEIAVRARYEAVEARGVATQKANEAVNAASQAIGAKDEVESIGNQVSEDREAVILSRADVEEKAGIAEQAVVNAKIEADRAATYANAFSDTIEAVSSITGRSKNLIDKTQIQSGYIRGSDGVFVSSTGYISIRIPIISGQTYTLSGIGTLPSSGSSPRLLFFTLETGSPISSIVHNTALPIIFTVPVGVNFVGINIAQQTNVATSPEGEAIKNAIQLELGSEVTSYAPYGVIIKESSLSPYIGEIQSEIEGFENSLSNLTNDSKNLIDKENIYFGYWGSTGSRVNSTSTISTPKIPIDPSKEFLSVNQWSNSLGVAQKVLFWDKNDVFISFVARSGNTGQGIEIPDNASFFAVNIVSGVSGVDATDNIYSNSFQVEYGIQSTSFESFGKKIKASALPGSYNTSFPITVIIIDSNNFVVKSRHDNGEIVDHTWTRLNKSPQYDIGWYAPDIKHNGNTIVQGSFNWIHIVDAPNENQHVGHGHGCETDLVTEFYVNGVLFNPSTQVGETIEGEIFSFNIATEIYAADATETSLNWNGSNVVPQLPLIVSTKHYMNGEIRRNSKMKYHNKLVIMRDNTLFSRCYLGMMSASRTFFDRIQLHNVENSMNDIQTLLPISPSTASLNGTSYNTAEGFRAELAWSATAYSDRYGYIFKTKCIAGTDLQKQKLHAQIASTTSKVYFHPIITTTIAAARGLTADVFNRGDVIEGIVERELIL